MKKTDKNTVIVSETGSSNNYAKQLISSGKAHHGTVVLTHFQSAGKGYAGNHWESEANKNLLASLVLFPEFLPAEKQFFLSKITSLALVDFLDETIDRVSIKWPNDIYAGDKKIGGILIENSVEGHYIQSSVIGVGLNINQEHFSTAIPRPVSLKQLTGREFSIESVAEKFQTHFWEWYCHLSNGQTDAIDFHYFNRLYRLNQWARFKKGEFIFEARIRGIGEFGQFILETRCGEVEEYLFKEIEFVI